MIESAVALIPARYGSKRFPGKLLKEIEGKSILQHVYREVIRHPGITDTFIVSGDEQITAECVKFGAQYVKAYDNFICGTDRCIHGFMSCLNYDIVINVQADQPDINHTVLSDIIQAFDTDSSIRIASLMAQNSCQDEAAHVVKVEVDADYNAIDFYRRLPHDRKTFQHIGVYGFAREIIPVLQSLGPTEREKELKLEQLRWMDNGLPIRMIPTAHVPQSIDVQESLLKLIKNED